MAKKKANKRKLEEDKDDAVVTTMTKSDDGKKGKNPNSKRPPTAATNDIPLTNKQKRQKLNEKNKWPQHPNIMNAEVRSKAYLRVAGLSEKVDNDKKQMSEEDWMKVGRTLGGTDQRVRHKAVKRLGDYLRARCAIVEDKENNTDSPPGLSELDLLKIWKALWYTLYMADKVPVQEQLAKHLSKLIWCLAGTEEEDEYAGQAYMDDTENVNDGSDDDVGILDDGTTEEEEEDDDEEEVEEEEDDEDDSVDDADVIMAEIPLEEPDEEEEQQKEEDDIQEVKDSEIPHCRGAHLASLFVRVFFRTLRREWGNMDKYRIDKFYTLVRYMVREVYSYMAIRHWNRGIVRLFNDAMYEEALSQTPNGLRFHLLDIALDELVHVNNNNKITNLPLTEATFLDCLEPFFSLTQNGTGDKVVQERAVEKVLVKFLDHHSVVSESKENNVVILDQVHVGTIANFLFDMASDEQTPDIFRKGLYEIHKKYMRRLRIVGSDVDLEDLAVGDKCGAEDDGGTEGSSSSAEDEMEPVVDGGGSSGGGGDEEESNGPNDKDGEVSTTEEEAEEATPQDKTSREESDVSDETNNNELKGAKRKRKKKKKKKKKKKNSEETTESEKEEVVTISLEEQKKAKTAMQQDDKKAVVVESKDKNDEDKNDEPASKRVSFGKFNRAKSYKASISSLRKMPTPTTKDKSPEKSILLNKAAAIVDSTKKSSRRKKAVDYF